MKIVLLLQSYHANIFQLDQKSKCELINSVSHLMDMFCKVHETPMANFATAPVAADFVSEIVPQYQSATFSLLNFSLLKRKADPVYSSHLDCNGNIVSIPYRWDFSGANAAV